MRRTLFNILTVLSVLLCLALIVLWVRSYYIEDMWHRWDGGWEDFKLSGGVIEHNRGLICTYGVQYDWKYARWRYEGWRARQNLWRQFGFGRDVEYAQIGPSTVGESNRIWSSLAVPLLLTVLAPGFWMMKRIRGSRRAEGACPSCGYDMRATPTRCPECGDFTTPRSAQNFSATSTPNQVPRTAPPE
jgi:hypothetical protein